jgi:hypothetical protein
VAIAQSRVVHWKTPDGHEERGLLTLPVNKSAKGPPPLVIQNYKFMPHLFRPDGPAGTGYAAQLLAARGIAVLGIELSSYEKQRGAEGLEGARGVMTIDAAVESLASKGLIDPKRVGMTGFSRGGFVPYYALTHPGRTKLAAAMSWDSVRFDYTYYITSGVLQYDSGRPSYVGSGIEKAVTGQDTGGSFWADKYTWLRENGEFSVERATGPYMFVGNGLGLDYYDQFRGLMGSFAIARRPLELLNFPIASHPMVRPREREASLSITTDWFDFWLNGHEDADPAKAEQYARWRKMESEWQRQQAWEATGNPVGTAPPVDGRAL